MPILQPEVALSPANLLDDFISSSGERNWLALYTKPRQEKALARQLFGLGVPFYLPLVQKVSLIKGRKVKSQLPLFSSYLFLYANEEERVQALGTDRIVQVLPAPSRDRMARDLQSIRSLIQAGVPLTIESRLDVGRRVRVKSGALMGLEGMVTARRGEDRLLVAIDFLQQGVSILIEDFQVEPV